ncbi:MAG: ankyrin repeat domain-containing protein [Planctomycetes bacterium]|nr:ankyrin repeat domain-containing protein [Planctomycetota bacterium]
MSEQFIISDKYDHIPDRKVSELCQYGLKFIQFEDRCTDSERAWHFSQLESEVTLTEMPYGEVDAWADAEIAALASLENDKTSERIGELTSALLKATTVITASPAEGADAEFVNRVVDAFAGDLRGVTKRDGAFIDTESRLIIDQSGDMADEAKADPYDESKQVPFPFTLASLGKLERLKAALADDPELMTKTDKVGRSLIHCPVQKGRGEVVRYLLENGADPNVRSKKVREPLFEVYSADVVTVLAEFGVDPSVVDKEGNSPLHRAAKQGFEDLVPALLKIGVDPAVANKAGEKAVDLVDTQFYPELVEMLK